MNRLRKTLAIRITCALAVAMACFAIGSNFRQGGALAQPAPAVDGAVDLDGGVSAPSAKPSDQPATPAPSRLAPDPNAPTLTLRKDAPPELKIGMPFSLILGVIHRKGQEIRKPFVSVPAGARIIADAHQLRDLADGNVREEFRYQVLALQVGKITIPGIDVEYLGASNTWRTARSDGIEIEIAGVVADEANALLESDPPPVRVYQPDHTILWWLIGFCVLALVSMGSVFVYRAIKRMPQSTPEILDVSKPPEELALERLRRLKHRWITTTSRNLATYYLELSEILRSYLGSRYGFDSLEMTTSEIVYRIQHHIDDKELRLEIRAWLEGCDLVKFANVRPDLDEADLAWDKAYQIVMQTRPTVGVETGPFVERAVAAPAANQAQNSAEKGAGE